MRLIRGESGSRKINARLDGEVFLDEVHEAGRCARTGWSFAEAVRHDIMCEPWKGIVDFKELKTVQDEINYEGFAVVEQDMYPAAPGRRYRARSSSRLRWPETTRCSREIESK
jgi:sugar phosphate isomerase/epimerase